MFFLLFQAAQEFLVRLTGYCVQSVVIPAASVASRVEQPAGISSETLTVLPLRSLVAPAATAITSDIAAATITAETFAA